MKTHSTAAIAFLLLVAGCSRHESKPATSKPTSTTTSTAKPETVPVGQRRVVELEGGIRVEVVAEGQGDVVAPGDHVALSMTLSYVPVAPAAAPAVGTEAKPTDAKATDSKPTDAKPADEAGDAKPDAQAAAEKATEKPAEPPTHVEGVVVLEGAAAAAAPVPPSEPGAAAKTEPVTSAATETAAPAADTETQPKPDVEPASGEPAAAAPEIAATTESAGAAPAPPLNAPLEPVVLMSTKSGGVPLRVVVGSSGALLPGLSRALIGLRQGSVVEITLSPEAAYGAAGLPSAGVPPGTPLFATVEIREVKR